jgi:zinc transport system substrate-binding protein
MLKAALRPAAALALAALTVTGCTTQTQPPNGAGMDVVASFYPVQFAAQRVVGDLARVRSLTPAGAEPHDLELTAKDVAALSQAELVVYLSGLQPAVDKAVATQAPASALDVAAAARLTPLSGGGHGDAGRTPSPATGASAGGAASTRAGGAGNDPHFWLDPLRLADVADAVASRLSVLRPDAASAFTANAAALRTELTALDAEFRAGLARCTSRYLVTSHRAFGYLADRYGLTQVGIAGLSPEAEPDARTLAELADLARANSVRTIYYETLVSPAVARTLAGSVGAATAVLDPIEGLAAGSSGDYLSIMRGNLATLRAGQPCS